jgi:hypothetical protein
VKYANLDHFELCTPLEILWRKTGETWLGRRNPRRNEPYVTPRVYNDGALLSSARPSLTWIGHSTFVLRLGGLTIATDPIWSEAAGRLVRRRTAPGIELERLPPIDVVTISHAHYDHLDLPLSVGEPAGRSGWREGRVSR